MTKGRAGKNELVKESSDLRAWQIFLTRFPKLMRGHRLLLALFICLLRQHSRNPSFPLFLFHHLCAGTGTCGSFVSRRCWKDKGYTASLGFRAVENEGTLSSTTHAAILNNQPSLLLHRTCNGTLAHTTADSSAIIHSLKSQLAVRYKVDIKVPLVYLRNQINSLSCCFIQLRSLALTPVAISAVALCPDFLGDLETSYREFWLG